MRRRIPVLLAALLIAALLSVVVRPAPALALQTQIVKVSGACGSISVDTTLLHISDDGNGEDRFWFRIFEGDSATQLVHIEESIARAESPLFWRNGPFAIHSANGLYRVEVWDLDKSGQPVRQIDAVYYQCLTGAAWRPATAFAQDPEVPVITCSASMPIWSTNTAPKAGTVFAVWSYSRKQTDDEYYVTTFRLGKGDRLYHSGLAVPCGVYIRLYWAADGGTTLTYLESQYHPHDNYGTPAKDGQRGPWYTTKLPTQ